MDQGFKPLIRRAFRDRLEKMFEKSGKARGKYHFTDRKLYEQVESFMRENLLFRNPTEKEIWGTAVLIYPTKGKDGNC